MVKKKYGNKWNHIFPRNDSCHCVVETNCKAMRRAFGGFVSQLAICRLYVARKYPLHSPLEFLEEGERGL